MQKRLVRWLIVLTFALAACTPGGFKPDHKYTVQPFSYENQHGEQVSLDDLKGEVWLAQFIFTNCTTVCLPMMANMTTLQKELEEEGITNYRIVSFSVDPAHDTPAIMGDYLNMYNPVDPSKWEMLTGYTQEHIAKFALDSFKQLVIDDETSDQVIHGTGFILVNEEGIAVKTYQGVQDFETEPIIRDMKLLLDQ